MKQRNKAGKQEGKQKGLLRLYDICFRTLKLTTPTYGAWGKKETKDRTGQKETNSTRGAKVT